MNLYKASNQWSTRPNDERFGTLAELHEAVSGYRSSAAEATITVPELRVQANGGEVELVGRASTPARLTHWSFGQLSASIGAPASYLRALPATLAAQNLNHGLSKLPTSRAGNDTTDAAKRLLLHRNGSLLVRAITGVGYTRIWNSDITGRLFPLLEQGWQVPPARPARADQPGVRPATEADVLRAGQIAGLSIKVGDPIAPAGLYASDHDLFVFLVDNEHRISEPGNPDGLARGFFVTNSEVGAASFTLTRFLYRAVCGNHIVWDAKQVTEIRLRHVGRADDRAFEEVRGSVIRYANESASEDEARIKRAAEFSLAATKDEVLDRLFAVKGLGLSRKQLDAAYELTVEHEPVSVNPNSAWGVAQGLTRLSQSTPFADERVAIDRAAGKVLSIAF